MTVFVFQAPIIVPHAQQKTDTKYPYEMLFRSEQYALVDNACRYEMFEIVVEQLGRFLTSRDVLGWN